MSVQHRPQPLGRLMIPPSLSSQQPFSFDNQPMWSPGLPTSIQQGMHPPFAYNTGVGIQTPMQQSFFPIPNAPGRPINHRAHASMIQLAAAGIHPPMGVPMTPLGQGQFPPQMLVPGQPFVPHRNRRTPSVSTGGPPKALLGGPAAKNRVVSDAAPPVVQAPVAAKPKKVIVKFPKETIAGKGDEPSRRESWARIPLLPSQVPVHEDFGPLEATTLPVYPADHWRHQIPETVDVFLPGKVAWDEYKQRIIDEKLEKLGIEQGFGTGVNHVSSNVPHIHAPHARAVSISSPADPALLFFKLNKLQQSQNGTATNSVTSSPQLSNMSPSPHLPGLPPHLQGRHGHSMSLVNPGTLPTEVIYNPSLGSNPFGSQAVMGSDQVEAMVPPHMASALQPPQQLTAILDSLSPGMIERSRPGSRPDFVVGFGLDIPEEEEPEEEEDIKAQEEEEDDDVSDAASERTMEETEVEEHIEQARPSHLGHRTRLSAALSLRSIGGHREQMAQVIPPTLSPVGNPAVDDLDAVERDTDAVGEWTGSEDPRGISSDEESIGEWSNPSDEERARQDRRQRRMSRRSQHSIPVPQDMPRKLPNFPRPPISSHLPPLPDQADDDIMSNPSDEDEALHRLYPRPLSNSSGQGRPLPPLPHSRATSAQFSYHDPALAHSRNASEVLSYHISSEMAPPASARSFASLNPFAKPFVFGASQATSWTSPVNTSPPMPQPFTHGRSISFGKPLNATASEFKPGGFTFKPPALAPQISFATPAADTSNSSSHGRPLPTPPDSDQQLAAREIQGREKRQRRGSSVTLDGDERKDGFNAFKFPPTSEIGKTIHRSAPPTPAAFESERRNSLGGVPQSFTVAGFLSDIPLHPAPAVASLGRTENIASRELPMPPQTKTKRAPIPLDFKHPVSTNTVPAGLFKALVNGEDDRSRRSRLGSRDVFDHSPRPSLDDDNVPTISRKISRPRLVTDPQPSRGRVDTNSPPPRRRRRSSLPALHSGSSFSEMSIVPLKMSRSMDTHQLEQRLESLLEDKLDAIHHDIIRRQGGLNSATNENTEAMLSEVVSLFRAQLQESAARGLEDSQIDARGELDFELIRGIIEQANTESRALIQRDLAEVLRRVEIQTRNMGMRNELSPLVEEITNRTVNAVVGVNQQLAIRMEALSSPSAVVHELMNLMGPHFAALRPEPIDYDGLTMRLSQAVKPNISQLIDLASDKRETAGLILERLMPVLQAFEPVTPVFDIDDMTTKIIAEVRKVVGQVDAHEIKEQVSDLVVERLDSRLANRDRLDGLAEKVSEAVANGLGPVPSEIASIFGKLATIHRDVSELNPEDLSSLRQDVVAMLSDLPSKLGAATESMNAALIDLRLQRSINEDKEPDQKLAEIESLLTSVSAEQKSIFTQTQEIISLHQDVVHRLSALPATLVEATNGLQDSQSDLVSRIQLSQQDAEELRRISANNSELQVQLAKARGAHGQVRVEKDVLSERLMTVEAEKDGLRTQLDELLVSIATKAAEASATEVRNSELEDALAQALNRLQSADAIAQSNQERILEFEKTNRDLLAEKQELFTKMHELDVAAVLSARDKQAAEEKTADLQRQLDTVSSQQEHWDAMHRAAEQIAVLTSLVEQADNDELRELRRNRDRTKILEGEYAALQRRYKDQETKIASHDRAIGGVRQNLAQAQQRAAEWEKRAKEQEAEIEATRSRLDESDQTQNQLDAELSLVKLQLQEKEADERTAKDREGKLRDQVAALEEQMARLHAETDMAKAKAAAAVAPVFVPSSRVNGVTNNSVFNPPPRPDSRASTVNGAESRSVTPTTINEKPTRAQLASKGVWNSMHNPYRAPAIPQARYSSSYRSPSPAMSTASVTPSVDADGWWS